MHRYARWIIVSISWCSYLLFVVSIFLLIVRVGLFNPLLNSSFYRQLLLDKPVRSFASKIVSSQLQKKDIKPPYVKSYLLFYFENKLYPKAVSAVSGQWTRYLIDPDLGLKLSVDLKDAGDDLNSWIKISNLSEYERRLLKRRYSKLLPRKIDVLQIVKLPSRIVKRLDVLVRRSTSFFKWSRFIWLFVVLFSGCYMVIQKKKIRALLNLSTAVAVLSGIMLLGVLLFEKQTGRLALNLLSHSSFNYDMVQQLLLSGSSALVRELRSVALLFWLLSVIPLAVAAISGFFKRSGDAI